MICSRYSEMTIVEKTDFIGKLIHIVQSHNAFFQMAKEMVESAEEMGCYQNIKILPEKEG